MSWTAEEEILVSRLHDPVTVLGYGKRVGIWMQGCSIGCAGCVSLDTWEFDQTKAVGLSEVLEWCGERLKRGRDGVTISGGEPFDQPRALRGLLSGLRELSVELDRPCDLLVYSGRPMRILRRRHPELLGLADAVIAGPYIADRPSQAAWMGSANQELVRLTPLSRERYGSDMDREPPSPRRLQVEVGERDVWIIGVPGPGDMEDLEKGLRSRGIELEGASWRP